MLDFTSSRCRLLEDALNRVWKAEEESEASRIIKLRNEATNIRRINNELIDKLATTNNATVHRQIEERIEERTKQIEELEDEICEIEERQNNNKQNFIDFALNFADNLGVHFFEIDLSLIKEFKLLLFSEGFFVNSNNKVYTTKISPFYGL